MNINTHCQERIIERAQKANVNPDNIFAKIANIAAHVVDTAIVLERVEYSEKNVVYFVMIERHGIGQTIIWTSRLDCEKMRVKQIVRAQVIK